MPDVRIDRNAGEDRELYSTLQILYRLADLVNAATRAGPIYGRTLLPEDWAERKRAMQGGQ